MPLNIIRIPNTKFELPCSNRCLITSSQYHKNSTNRGDKTDSFYNSLLN